MAPQPLYGRRAAAVAAEGWTLERLTPPSRLLRRQRPRAPARTGASMSRRSPGSQVSAIDLDSGAIETISPMGGGIVGARRSRVRRGRQPLLHRDHRGPGAACCTPDGTTRGDPRRHARRQPDHLSSGPADRRRVPHRRADHGARPQRRRAAGDPRRRADGQRLRGRAGRHALFPGEGANEIWRVSLDGGAPEVVASDLGVPDSVKFDAQGCIVSTQVGSGQVLRIDPRSGAREVLADIGAGARQCAPSSAAGSSCRISPARSSRSSAAGKVRPLIDKGCNGRWAWRWTRTATLFVADGTFAYTLRAGRRATAGRHVVLARLSQAFCAAWRPAGAGRVDRHDRQRRGRALRPPGAESEFSAAATIS